MYQERKPREVMIRQDSSGNVYSVIVTNPEGKAIKLIVTATSAYEATKIAAIKFGMDPETLKIVQQQSDRVN